MAINKHRTLIESRIYRILFVVSFFTVGVLGQYKGQAKVVPGEYIIKYKMDLSRSNAIGKIQGKVTLKTAFPEMNMLHMAVKHGQESAVQDIKNDPDVLFIEPNYILEKLDNDNESQSSVGQVVEQLSLDQVYAQSSSAFTQNYSNVRVDQAWQLSSAYASNNRPIVAILDTGLDKDHVVFKNSGALWVNLKEIPGNGIDDDQNGYIDDINGWNFISNAASFADDEGHGTHVGGIIVGATLDIFSQNIDQAKIQIMPLKFLDAQGSGSTANAIKAIYYAVNNGAKIINNSWGGPGYSSALLEALTYAYNHQILIVSAAGNSSKNNDSNEIYPANYGVPSNVSIAATSDTDKLASFSNYGIQKVHLASPGIYIYSTLPGNLFGSMSGTSMAAPFVSGIAALALREAPALSGYQLKSLLVSSGYSIGNLASKIQSGSRIDAYSLVSQVKTNPGITSNQPEYKPSYSEERSVASEAAPDSSPKSGGGCGTVASSLLGKGGGAPFDANSALAVLFLFMVPLAVYTYLKAKTKTPTYVRQHDRFIMNSDITVKMGDRELVAQMKTISMGGLSFNIDEMLEKGGSVSMKIKGPDNQEIEVEGRVVWSEANHAYGVKFEEEKGMFTDAFMGWKNKLVKTD
ncbi:MAG: S8 family serine peptidase [Deltaproteobacteria bacterium]|nr:S8 family serine peptidase [Deltaproteobacteria bacterium]